MNYNEALNFIAQKQRLGIKPGLSRILSLLEIMDNPQDRLKIIHIAGTNGKGTVANTIANALQNNGLKIGLFTSPWLTDYREQIQINGEFIAKKVFAEYVTEYSHNSCTEFEMLTAIMYKYFCDKKVDYAIVECGMGGRGDATNVENKNIAVLTSISLDHTDFLGSTIEKITKEKEGIIKPNCPVFRFESTGDIDKDNLTLAKKVVSHLGYSDDISLVKPLARQQRINGILFDGGHNLEAGKALEPLLSNEVAIIGMMKDKDIKGYLSFVAPHCKKIYCVNVDNPRAVEVNELLKIAKEYCKNVEIIKNPADAIKQKDVTLVCGSFYMIREIINLI